MSKHAATLLALVFIVALSITLDNNQVAANPYIEQIEVPPPLNPSLIILFPAENNTLRNSNELTVNFNVTIKSESATTWITRVDYNASWQPNNIVIWQWSDHDIHTPDDDDPYLPEYSFNLTLTEIPEGKQTVTITAYGSGGYTVDAVRYVFHAVNSYAVGFTVDTVPPVVSVLELDNKTLVEAPLSLVTNEATSKISYVLDGQKNVTIAGNTTLVGLPTGSHAMIIYVWDAAGNIGKSETVNFTIAEPFPTTLLVGSAVAVVAVVGLGLLVYRMKRSH